MLAAAYVQDLNPLGHRALSTLVAALPVLALFYLLVVRRWLAPWAGLAGSAVAVVVAWLVYGMPAPMALAAFAHGAWFGLVPIGWTVFNAMLLYNLTVATGQFAVIRQSIGRLSPDARCQAVLIAFGFGAFMEGAAGAGSPVAICGAMLVGLGFDPFRAAVICLIANTSPVAYGGLGVPISTLAGVTGIDGATISVMAAHQLPLMSCLVPAYMVAVLVGPRRALQVWPVLLVGGGSFAVFQFTCATAHLYVGVELWPLTDICGGILSMLTTAAFLRFVWRPSEPWHFPAAKDLPADPAPLSPWRVVKAWSPFALMSLCLIGTGFVPKAADATVLGVPIRPALEVPGLHREVERAAPLQRPGLAEPEREDARFVLPWLTAPGTPVLAAFGLSLVVLRPTRAQLRDTLRTTARQMRVPLPTIALMLGLSYVTKYAGLDATLGVAFAESGRVYPFFAAMLGWLGVFLTGTDAGSNALFGSLQKITATQIHNAGAITALSLEQTQTLICTANSTGGVMGKMIDAQSICVATAGTNQVGREADIFKAVVWHSVLLASLVGLLTLAQAYLWPFTRMVP